MNGSEMQTLGGILIIAGVLFFVISHFLLKLWKKRIFRKMNENPGNGEFGGGQA